MPNVKIKQLDNRVACSGLHFGLGPLCRKLEPGEVVFLEQDGLFRELFNTGKLELTMDKATRPLEFASEEEARMTSVTFRPRDDSEEDEMRRHREAVAARMTQSPVFVNDEPEVSQDVIPNREETPSHSTAESNTLIGAENEPQTVTEKPSGAGSRRAARRAAAKAGKNGEQENIT